MRNLINIMDLSVEEIDELITVADDIKQNPEKYRGHVGDVSTVIRVALTGRTNTPDLYSISELLGRERVIKRLNDALKHYKEEN